MADQGIRLLPRVMSSTKNTPIFVPSIPRICDAILDQFRYQMRHAENFPNRSKVGARPLYHVRNFVRYLYLERPSQREALLPLMAERNRAMMEQRIDAFVRKPTREMTRKMTLEMASRAKAARKRPVSTRDRSAIEAAFLQH